MVAAADKADTSERHETILAAPKGLCWLQLPPPTRHFVWPKMAMPHAGGARFAIDVYSMFPFLNHDSRIQQYEY
jgi:hypothetical protein